MAKKEMLEIANRVQKRIQRQLSETRFIAQRNEIENEFQQSEFSHRICQNSLTLSLNQESKLRIQQIDGWTKKGYF